MGRKKGIERIVQLREFASELMGMGRKWDAFAYFLGKLFASELMGMGHERRVF